MNISFYYINMSLYDITQSCCRCEWVLSDTVSYTNKSAREKFAIPLRWRSEIPHLCGIFQFHTVAEVFNSASVRIRIRNSTSVRRGMCNSASNRARVCRKAMAVCTENAMPPTSTKSRISDFSESRGTKSNWDSGAIWICMNQFECLNLVDFRGVAFSVETVIITYLSLQRCRIDPVTPTRCRKKKKNPFAEFIKSRIAELKKSSKCFLFCQTYPL